MAQMREAVQNPAAALRNYRAMPPEHLEINPGDWVTLSRPYAHDHGYVDDGPDWPVVYADVAASAVWTDGNDPSEYGYDGPALTSLTPYAEGEPMPAHPVDPAPTMTARHDQVDVGADEETVDFRPSPGARAERRVPPAADAESHGRGIHPA